MTYRLGIIGAGSIGTLHAQAAESCGVQIAAICDERMEQAERLGGSHPGARLMKSLEELLRSDVDAVVVALPNDLHHAAATTCMRAGKHVMLEKPMAISAALCDEILAAQQESGRYLQLSFVCRFAPAVARARAIIEAGTLGRIDHMRASLQRRRGIPGLGRWFTTRARSGGGVVIDLGVHLIDLAMHLAGRPQPARVSAACASMFGHPIERYMYEEMWAGPPQHDGVFDVEDSAVALIRFESSMTLGLSVAWAGNMLAAAQRDGIQILGDRGGCFLEIWSNQVTITTERDGAVVDEVAHTDSQDTWMEAWTEQHRHFARAVMDSAHQREAGLRWAQEGRAVQATVDAIYRSSAARREMAIA
jgi:predicted dehydrogenase